MTFDQTTYSVVLCPACGTENTSYRGGAVDMTFDMAFDSTDLRQLQEDGLARVQSH